LESLKEKKTQDAFIDLFPEAAQWRFMEDLTDPNRQRAMNVMGQVFLPPHYQKKCPTCKFITAMPEAAYEKRIKDHTELFRKEARSMLEASIQGGSFNDVRVMYQKHWSEKFGWSEDFELAEHQQLTGSHDMAIKHLTLLGNKFGIPKAQLDDLMKMLTDVHLKTQENVDEVMSQLTKKSVALIVLPAAKLGASLAIASKSKYAIGALYGFMTGVGFSGASMAANAKLSQKQKGGSFLCQMGHELDEKGIVALGTSLLFAPVGGLAKGGATAVKWATGIALTAGGWTLYGSGREYYGAYQSGQGEDRAIKMDDKELEVAYRNQKQHQELSATEGVAMTLILPIYARVVGKKVKTDLGPFGKLLAKAGIKDLSWHYFLDKEGNIKPEFLKAFKEEYPEVWKMITESKIPMKEVVDNMLTDNETERAKKLLHLLNQKDPTTPVATEDIERMQVALELIKEYGNKQAPLNNDLPEGLFNENPQTLAKKIELLRQFGLNDEQAKLAISSGLTSGPSRNPPQLPVEIRGDYIKVDGGKHPNLLPSEADRPVTFITRDGKKIRGHIEIDIGEGSSIREQKAGFFELSPAQGERVRVQKKDIVAFKVEEGPIRAAGEKLIKPQIDIRTINPADLTTLAPSGSKPVPREEFSNFIAYLPAEFIAEHQLKGRLRNFQQQEGGPLVILEGEMADKMFVGYDSNLEKPYLGIGRNLYNLLTHDIQMTAQKRSLLAQLGKTLDEYNHWATFRRPASTALNPAEEKIRQQLDTVIDELAKKNNIPAYKKTFIPIEDQKIAVPRLIREDLAQMNQGEFNHLAEIRKKLEWYKEYANALPRQANGQKQTAEEYAGRIVEPVEKMILNTVNYLRTFRKYAQSQIELQRVQMESNPAASKAHQQAKLQQETWSNLLKGMEESNLFDLIFPDWK
ncbi:MAG: hypothetical protein WCG27_07935, partial [Pseudomonadota bacterium]